MLDKALSAAARGENGPRSFPFFLSSPHLEYGAGSTTSLPSFRAAGFESGVNGARSLNCDMLCQVNRFLHYVARTQEHRLRRCVGTADKRAVIVATWRIVRLSIDPDISRRLIRHAHEERSVLKAYTKATWRARFCDCRVRAVIT